MVDLADHLQLTKAAITKTVDSLESGGLVTRERHETDRRVVLATLTSKGSRVLGGAEAAFESVLQQRLWDHLTERETASVSRVLAKVQNQLGLPSPLMPPRELDP